MTMRVHFKKTHKHGMPIHKVKRLVIECPTEIFYYPKPIRREILGQMLFIKKEDNSFEN